MRSFEYNKENPKEWTFKPTLRTFGRDILVTGFDCLSGFAIAALVTRHSSPATFNAAILGAIGGVLPDFLNLVYYVFPKSLLKYFKRFHHAVHADMRLDNNYALGLSMQLAILFLLAAVLVR
ncbi:MAG: hypothetical protein V1489_00030 [Candidatus Liptonbacteria bacterium]